MSALTNNQLSSTGFSYDGAGNMTNDGANAYTYNAESETTSAAGVTYTYDGDGNRVEKSSGKIYWYGAGSEILDETNLSGTIQLEMVSVLQPGTSSRSWNLHQEREPIRLRLTLQNRT